MACLDFPVRLLGRRLKVRDNVGHYNFIEPLLKENYVWSARGWKRRALMRVIEVTCFGHLELVTTCCRSTMYACDLIIGEHVLGLSSNRVHLLKYCQSWILFSLAQTDISCWRDISTLGFRCSGKGIPLIAYEGIL